MALRVEGGLALPLGGGVALLYPNNTCPIMAGGCHIVMTTTFLLTFGLHPIKRRIDICFRGIDQLAINIILL